MPLGYWCIYMCQLHVFIDQSFPGGDAVSICLAISTSQALLLAPNLGLAMI